MLLAKLKVGMFLVFATFVETAAATAAYQAAHDQPQPAPAKAGRSERNPGTSNLVVTPAPDHKRQTATDLYGDALPEGAITRLGTLRLRLSEARLAFLSDGKTIVSVGRGQLVKHWDADTGVLRAQYELPVRATDTAYLSPDGRTLVLQQGVNKAQLDVWDVVSRTRLRRLRLPHNMQIYLGVFSPDGSRLALCDSASKSSILMDIQSGVCRRLKEHWSLVKSLVFSPDGKLIAIAGGAGCVLCWDVATAKQLWFSEFSADALAFSADSGMLVASPIWHVWNARTGVPAARLKLPKGYGSPRVAMAPDGRSLVLAQPRAIRTADRRIRVWDVRSGTLRHTLPTTGEIGPFAPDGRSVLINDGILQRWDLETGAPLFPETRSWGHWREVRAAVYSPDGRRLATAAGDGNHPCLGSQHRQAAARAMRSR